MNENPSENNVSRLLTIEEVADLLQVKKMTVYSWVHFGKIPFVKLNGLVRFKRFAIERWIDKKSVTPKRTLDPQI